MHKKYLLFTLSLSAFMTALPSYANEYIFSWPFIETENMQPRGGTSKGPDVSLDIEVSESFKSIQEQGISDFERDRRAILAMAGPYRVSFDFLEVAGFEPNFNPSAPYQSWGTEYVYVITNESEFISLQHLLVMTIVDEKGTSHGPFITKHWRQDWQYEKATTHRYQGLNTWQKQPIDSDEAKGSWVQTVWQVDDSPRYSGWGKWQHTPTYSSWKSNETWRPLPRREYSVRADYDLLIGQNTHTIIADGWIHEEQNSKAVLESISTEKHRIAREYGVARYQRIKEYDFSPGDEYLDATQHFWEQVRRYWAELFNKESLIHLKAPIDQAGLFMPLFERAQNIADHQDSGNQLYTETENWQFIKQTIDGFLSDSPQSESTY